MNDLIEKIQINFPVIQAGMAGGIATPELVAAVANEGGLGTLGAGYMSPVALKEDIKRVKKKTKKPFAVNLFATNLNASSENIAIMQQSLNKMREKLGVKVGPDAVKVKDYLQEKVSVIEEECVPVVSTAFGVLPSDIIKRLKKNYITLIGMATNVEEAKQLEEAGYDIVVAQGFEAGGHRGTFDIDVYPSGCHIGLHVLVQSCLESLTVPVVAAGGIHTKEQINALFEMGASGVQLGTKFLVAKEAGTNQAYRDALMKAGTNDTVVTSVFSGRPARAISNQFVKEVESSGLSLAPFPIQNELTKDIRIAGKVQFNPEFQSLWAGQGVYAISEEATVKEIMKSLTG